MASLRFLVFLAGNNVTEDKKKRKSKYYNSFCDFLKDM